MTTYRSVGDATQTVMDRAGVPAPAPGCAAAMDRWGRWGGPDGPLWSFAPRAGRGLKFRGGRGGLVWCRGKHRPAQAGGAGTIWVEALTGRRLADHVARYPGHP
jgi:hypothetical protein